MVDSLVKQLTPLANRKNIELVRSGLKEKVFVKSSKHHLQKAIRNILENAIKYSKESGQVSVSIKYDDTKFSNKLLITIVDHGIGIKSKELESIFDRFYRTDKARNIREGSGLGLAITKDIIDAHGGKLEVKSKYGKGTTVIITLQGSLIN